MPSSEFNPVSGHCECQAVHYTVTAPAQELYHCHCSRCRRLHGSLFATYAYQKREEIEINHGDTELSIYQGPLARWYFCRHCGCHLFAEHDHNPGVMWYMPSTLKDQHHPAHPPETEKHIFTASRSALETLSGDLPQYDEYAPPEVSITARKTHS